MPQTIGQCQTLTVSASSAKFTNPMTVGVQYIFRTTIACYISVEATGGAATTSDTYIPADGFEYVAAIDSTESYLHVIGAAGTATLTPIVNGALA